MFGWLRPPCWLISELKSVVTSTTIIPIDPVFLPTANNITVREGGKAELPCSVQYLSTKKVCMAGWLSEQCLVSKTFRLLVIVIIKERMCVNLLSISFVVDE